MSSDKWTIQVVVALRSGAQRFNEIKRRVGGISQQMLTRTSIIRARVSTMVETALGSACFRAARHP
ncbi:MAG: winged helix-turn-helix transcriptional regulator [Pseudomonadota bacterium]